MFFFTQVVCVAMCSLPHEIYIGGTFFTLALVRNWIIIYMIYNVGVTIIEVYVLPKTKPYYYWFHLKNPTECAKQIHNVQFSHYSFVYDARTIDTSNADIIHLQSVSLTWPTYLKVIINNIVGHYYKPRSCFSLNRNLKSQLQSVWAYTIA